MNLTRRAYLQYSGGALLSLGLAQFLRRTATATDAGAERIDTWMSDLTKLGRQLGGGKISQLEWQQGMDEVFGQAPITELLTWVDFPRLSDELAHRDLGGRGEIFHTLFIGEPGRTVEREQGEPSRMLVAKFAHVKKGRAIPPHGHSSMVSAFLVLSGEFHVRQFDKLEDRLETMIVRATIDERQRAGRWSSISDYRGNVHWLTAESDDCFLFTSKLIRLEPARPFSGRINVDVVAAKELGDGALEAPKISSQMAADRY